MSTAATPGFGPQALTDSRPGDVGARTRAWVLLALFFFLVNGIEAAYGANDIQVPAGLSLLVRALAIPMWWKLLEAECRPYRIAFPLDMGLFLYGATLAVLPYYFWRTQRWRGMGKLVLLAGVWLATYVICAGAAWLALAGLE